MLPPDSNIADFLPLAALYAETHYRFRFFPFSLYYRRQPEIIFDAPHRLDPGHALPVALIIKDADRFPVMLKSVKITAVSPQEQAVFTAEINETIKQPFKHFIFYVDVNKLPPGKMTVHTEAIVQIGRREFIVRQDNHPPLAHKPFKVYKSADPLPNFANWHAGEIHCHTEYGGDQIEFGAPLEYIKAGSEAMGLRWAALTDHSYNLDDQSDNYLIDDPKLRKWQQMKNHAANLNREPGVVLVPGEELTCRNAQYRNIHLLILGNEEFLHGTGDGAQKWLQTRSQLSVREALEKISPDAFAAAAHPFVKPSFLEWLLVRRGSWQASDVAEPRLDGWQILNGIRDDGYKRGLEKWSQALDRGERVKIFGGNDAHGNFNSYRQIRIPMLSMRECENFIFGRMTTRIFKKNKLNQNNIVSSLKNNTSYVSEGPALVIEPSDLGKIPSTSHVKAGQNIGSIRIHFKSTPEFGGVISITLVTKGTSIQIQAGRNDRILNRYVSSWEDEFIVKVDPKEYIRAELTSIDSKGKTYKAFTNPILF